jgi:glycosyltransferase involved in cell wall biosynthesis
MFDDADLVLCLALEEAELVDRTYPCGARTVVVPCPVDDVVRPDRAAIETVAARFGLEPGRYATVVGRLDPAKGSDDAIRFTDEYRRAVDPTFTLAAIGPGQANVRSEGVVTTGFVDEATKDALVAGSQVVVQPSYMESFSLSLMEGWLLERPALVQQRSTVLAGHVMRSGGGVAYGDYLDFEAALTAVLTRPAIADRLGRCGRAYVRREFDWSVVAPAFIAAAGQAAEAGRRRLVRERIRT